MALAGWWMANKYAAATNSQPMLAAEINGLEPHTETTRSN